MFSFVFLNISLLDVCLNNIKQSRLDGKYCVRACVYYTYICLFYFSQNGMILRDTLLEPRCFPAHVQMWNML